MIIDKKQYDFYWENGYLIVEKLVPKEDWQDLLENLRKFHDKDWASIMNPDRASFLMSQAIDHFPKNKKIKDKVDWFESVSLTALEVRNLMKNKAIVDVLEGLYRSEISALMSHILWKEPGSPYANQWWHPHQDNSYAKNPNGKYFTTNLFFQDADPDNGMINIYPGTHKYGLLPYEPQVSYHEEVGAIPGNKTIFPEDYDYKKNKVDLSVKAGDFLIMHGDCVHGSYPNKTNRSRALLSASYVTKGAFFEPGISANRKEISLR
jgi:ectoine hydroxylase-related dioxygenase (phytanoyl-CoA dioxygenase family)